MSEPFKPLTVAELRAAVAEAWFVSEADVLLTFGAEHVEIAVLRRNTLRPAGERAPETRVLARVELEEQDAFRAVMGAVAIELTSCVVNAEATLAREERGLAAAQKHLAERRAALDHATRHALAKESP